ncbi:dr1-associated corepressor isoform X1 [Hemibagrus wyckioides]|uniref:dr1-associated corepressor isoform X1 n=1 Tax=Hemibagrus wyckioides TaxID=337641 RepID=UPI00266D815D|nr:dr1-associated corepressor isoform X1 [Hemibagrus wyckioides]
MPSKKKKYNARFPPARIKKIMQTDEEIGKVAAAVPVIISRALELFLESLLTKACHVTQSRNAKTMTTSHLKQCIELEQQFDFLKDLVAAVPDMQGEGEENHAEGAERIPRRSAFVRSGADAGREGLARSLRSNSSRRCSISLRSGHTKFREVESLAQDARTEEQEPKAKTRSCQAQSLNKRTTLRTARQMETKRTSLSPTHTIRHHPIFTAQTCPLRTCPCPWVPLRPLSPCPSALSAHSLQSWG